MSPSFASEAVPLLQETYRCPTCTIPMSLLPPDGFQCPSCHTMVLTKDEGQAHVVPNHGSVMRVSWASLEACRGTY